MLVRLLHRPLLRSVAAAWQPATTSALLHKGDRRRYNTNEPGQPHQDDQQDDQHNRVVGGLAASQSEPKLEPVSSSPAEKKKKSLFEKLFPDELKQARSTLKRDDVNTFRNSWVSQIFEEPPRPGQTALEKPRSESGEKGKEDESPSTMAASDFYKSSGPRGKAMLILSGASKHLNESDFMRLGMKGKHLDGWMGGIQKGKKRKNIPQSIIYPYPVYSMKSSTWLSVPLSSDPVSRLRHPRAKGAIRHILRDARGGHGIPRQD